MPINEFVQNGNRLKLALRRLTEAEGAAGLEEAPEHERQDLQQAETADGSYEWLWPEPLEEAAYQGVVGEWIHRLEPHTESDAAALLTQFLACIGNLFGRSVFYQVEGVKHHTNIFVCIVGKTAKGRKGTAYQHASRLMRDLESAWMEAGGLSSGEGIIHAVRDSTEGDDGVRDKRLLVYEPEFATVLKLVERPGNTLSAIVRQAWDTGNLRVMTKNTPLRATQAHISMIAHITKEELLTLLTNNQAANGFANRFLFVAAARSKCLPRGGRVDSLDFSSIQTRLSTAIQFANASAAIDFDAEAGEIWDVIYPELSDGKAGLAGMAIGRAEAQVVRLALVYALLDCSSHIGADHLRAALAVWEYAEATARYVFGDATGNPIADEILHGLRGKAGGMSRTEIRDLFARNKNSTSLQGAIGTLLEAGLARCVKIKRPDKIGRPEERYYAVK
jgi:hypothetical protein